METTPECYSLAEVLAVAQIHPFYHPDVQYPPNAKALKATRELVANEAIPVNLLTQPLLQKKSMYVYQFIFATQANLPKDIRQ